jgi:hypothetical protein
MKLTIASELLVPKEPSTPGFRGSLWVKKGTNVFRAVIEYRCKNETPTALAGVVRDIVKREFKPGHFIPFAFGAILHFDGTAPGATDMARHIDTKARWRDTWQWMILCDHFEKKAVGIHTWIHGYLRPVYEDLLKQLEAQGYQCTSQDRAVDEVFTRMWTLNARLLQTKRALLLFLAALALPAFAGRLLAVWK